MVVYRLLSGNQLNGERLALQKINSPVFHALDFQGIFVQILNGECAPIKAARHGINPATLEPLPEVPVATQGDLDSAVAAAKSAFQAWSKIPYEERRSSVLAFAGAIESLRTEFQDLLISEQGKPIPQADAETDAAMACIRGMANIPLPEELIEDTEKRTIVTRHPGIDKIRFTGSTATGKAVLQSANPTLTRVTLELYVPSRGISLREI
ncbi:hypothetical protein KVR01_009089 [Diaporthe batatas]|uniref:uncharacterized protein n=1 Tax=Diaporthe batatas TaxID=748121 RepID=UPI001D03F2A1|nr:uncharacterized protein KVR01_009089 [Diaporthe batatas]KAG8160825.1 hypothetical protein KVR01_009089 [Diaporthe batatas]